MPASGNSTVTIHSSSLSQVASEKIVQIPSYDRERLEDIGFLASMTFVLMGNYHQTGHFGGPTAYMPYTVATHLAGPENGGLTFDYRRPKHPFADKFMLAGGHNVPAGYALWMIMGEALARRHASSGDDRYKADPNVSMLSIDALGFRRGAGALATILQENDLTDHPAMAQARFVVSAHWQGIRNLRT